MGRVLRQRNTDVLTPSDSGSTASDSSVKSRSRNCTKVGSENGTGKVKKVNRCRKADMENHVNILNGSVTSKDKLNTVNGERSILVDKTNSTVKNTIPKEQIPVKIILSKIDGVECDRQKSDENVKSVDESNILVNKTNSTVKNIILKERSSVKMIPNNNDITDTNKRKCNDNVDSVNEKEKNKVHFKSCDNIKRITKRRISDFFHDVEHHDKEHKLKDPTIKCHNLKELKPCQKREKNILSETINSSIIENGSKSPPHNLFNNKSHVPVYKKPVLAGDGDFHLTPPQVDDKNALYEFEVDENEEPKINKKKRRPIKTYKKRKRICATVTAIKPTEIEEVPQKTMTLRNDGQINNVNYADISTEDSFTNGNKVNNTPVSIRKNLTSENRRNRIHQLNNFPSSSEHLTTNKLNVQNEQQNLNDKQGLNRLNSKHVNFAQNKQQMVQNIPDRNKQVQNGSELTNNLNRTNCQKTDKVINVSDRNHSDVNSIVVSNDERIIECLPNEVDPSIIEKGNSNTNITVVSNASHRSQNVSTCTSMYNSPLPDYSRLNDGIKIGPVYASSPINCNDAEYHNHFFRGLTASTPFRNVDSPRQSNYQVRLSGGNVQNKYTSIVTRSDDEDEDENVEGNGEEFFGFSVKEINHDRISNVILNKSLLKDKTVPAEVPVKKISVPEVISLLKKEVKVPKHNKLKAISNKTVIFNGSSESSGNSSDDSSSMSTNQQRMDKFVTNMNSEKEKKDEDDIELNTSFTKPPRRSYSHTPRRKVRFNYHGIGEVESEKSDVELESPKKPPKKRIYNKVSKKEEKEIEKLAAQMNSQFKEVEQFNLCVE